MNKNNKPTKYDRRGTKYAQQGVLPRFICTHTHENITLQILQHAFCMHLIYFCRVCVLFLIIGTLALSVVAVAVMGYFFFPSGLVLLLYFFFVLSLRWNLFDQKSKTKHFNERVYAICAYKNESVHTVTVVGAAP